MKSRIVERFKDIVDNATWFSLAFLLIVGMYVTIGFFIAADDGILMGLANINSVCGFAWIGLLLVFSMLFGSRLWLFLVIGNLMWGYAWFVNVGLLTLHPILKGIISVGTMLAVVLVLVIYPLVNSGWYNWRKIRIDFFKHGKGQAPSVCVWRGALDRGGERFLENMGFGWNGPPYLLKGSYVDDDEAREDLKRLRRKWGPRKVVVNEYEDEGE